MIIFVKNACVVRDGFTRLELDIHGTADNRARTLAAAVYRVAARLEEFAAAEGFAYSVSVCKARLGILEISYVYGSMDGDGMDDDLAQELILNACGENDLFPIDMLVEGGQINPSADA